MVILLLANFTIIVVGDNETDNGGCNRPEQKKLKLSLDGSSPSAEHEVGQLRDGYQKPI